MNQWDLLMDTVSDASKRKDNNILYTVFSYGPSFWFSQSREAGPIFLHLSHSASKEISNISFQFFPVTMKLLPETTAKLQTESVQTL